MMTRPTMRSGGMLALLLVTLAAVPAPAADEDATAATPDPKALEILAKVDAATRAVDAVSYEATATPAGAATANMGAARGRAILQGNVGGQPRNFFAEVQLESPRGPVHVTGGGNGDMFFLIDHTAKKAYEDMDPGVLGSLGNAFNVVNMIEFVHDEPFSDELNSTDVAYRGTTEVAGVECHEIHVKYAGVPGLESTWYFSTKDYLPRRRIQIFQTPNGEGRIDRVISNLVVDPDLPPSTFTMKLPAGYTRIDDFAP